MKHKILSMTLPVCLLMALAAAFLFASPAFAQDEVPPAPVEAPAETPDVSTGEEVPVETPVAEALAEAGLVLADESGEPVSLASTEAADALLNGDPYYKVGTTTYYYKFPGLCGGAANCFESDNPIQMAIDDIKNVEYGVPTDGTLYFTGDYAVDDIYLENVPALKKLVGATDAATGQPTVNINLTSIFQIGGQNNFSMSGFNITGDTTTQGSSYGVLEFWGSTGTLTLENLVVRNLAADGVGIDIWTHLGPVVMQNIESSNNGGGGAYIDNNETTAYPVTIKNSSFQNNGGTDWVNGLYIDTKGAVLLDGVTVNYNGYNDGTYAAAFIQDSGALTVKNSVFSNNWVSGLSNIFGDDYDTPINGAVVLDNVFANDNRHFIDIDNEFGGAGINLANNGAFTANNVHANGNKFQGMIVDTCWSVEVPEGSGNWVCSTTAVGNVIINNSEFSHNYSNGSGLMVDAKGAITLTNVDASWNRGINRPIIDPPTPGDGSPTYVTAGARLNNYSFTTAYPVTVNSSTFNYNSEDGLEIRSKGLVTINKVHADNNGTEIDEFGGFISARDGYGIDIYNPWSTSGVTFNGTTWGDNSTYGNAYGLRVNIQGNILLNYLDSSYNSYTNASLTNFGPSGNVTVNKSTFNHSWNEYGLWVTSRGIVTLNNVTTSENNWRGTVIDNTTAATPKAVKVTGGNFDENVDAGLEIYSHGAITVTNVHVGNNGEKGAFLRNDYLTPTGAQIVQPVTVSGSTFEYNGESGFEVQTFGAITVKTTQSNGNYGHGAYLTNRDAIAAKAVTISGSSFNENGTGLTIDTKGLVNLSGVDASNNSIREGGVNPGDAVHEYVASQVDDTWWIYANQDDVISITLEHGDDWWDPYLELWFENGDVDILITEDDDSGGDNNSEIINFTMLYSGSYYILAHSYDYSSSGNYTLKYWQGAEPGFWNDVYFYDANGLTVRNSSGAGVTITNGSFSNNSGYGLDIESYGAVKLTSVNASDNTYYGANIDNRDKGATAGVTLISSRFDGNHNDGLNIRTNGAVLLTKTVANDNWNYGAYIDNTDDVLRKMAVTITNDAAKIDWWYEGFSGNGLNGLMVFSNGVISLTNVNASDNGSTGAFLKNDEGPVDVKLTNAVFESNSGAGVEVLTQGNIIYNKGRANYNYSGRGAYLVTYPTIGIKNVTITGVEFYNNWGDGLYVRNNGNITLTNVQASDNYGENAMDDYAKGADLNNEAGTGSITIKTSSFNNNNHAGLLIGTHGNVTLTTVHADNNDYMGALIGSDDPDHLVKVVAISGMSTFYDNGDSGLEVYATGNITLTNVDAAGNGYYGAYLNNTGGTGNVSLLGTLTTWINWFGDNDRTGLLIETNGAVVVNKLDASNNGQVDTGHGVYIDNHTGAGNVTINTGWYNNNTGYGLRILTKGTVLINSLTASNNNGDGTLINNDDDVSGTKSVTVNKSTFIGNGSNGLSIGSRGNIILNAVNSSDNTAFASGAYLYNLGGTGTVTVLNTLGANTFNGNAAHGLWIASDLAVSITGVTANFNGNGYGIYIDNDAGAIAPVTLTKTTTNYNYEDGVYIASDGAVTINSAVSMFNGVGNAGYGFTILYDHTAFLTTISNSVAIGNGGYGIFLYKNGGTYLFTNTLYFGNNVDGGYGNLFITDVL